MVLSGNLQHGLNTVASLTDLGHAHDFILTKFEVGGWEDACDAAVAVGEPRGGRPPHRHTRTLSCCWCTR